MKLKIHLLCLIMISLNCHVGAQEGSDFSELTTTELIRKIDDGVPSAILELGRRGDTSVIPYLQKLAADVSKEPTMETNPSWAKNIQMALAKLGQKKEFDGILSELKNDDPAVQDAAVEKLAYIGRGQAVQVLIGLLNENDTKYRVKESRLPDGHVGDQGRIVFSPLSHSAIKSLAKIVPNPPTPVDVRRSDLDKNMSKYIQKWKNWWEANKSKYASE